jgi:CBS domain-containing protein
VMRTDFVVLQRDDRLKYILRMFAKKRITSAPVLDEGDFIGIVDINMIVRFCTPKRYFFIWKKDARVSLRQLEKVMAAKLAKKPKFVLSPDQMLSDVLAKISSEADCIPVLDKKKKLVGIVRNEDLVKLFLRRFAKGVSEPICGEEKGVGTEIDRVLEVVMKHEWIPARKVARKLGLSEKTVERMGEVLKDHDLIKMRYTFLGGAELGRISTEKGGRKKKKPAQ